MGKKRVSSKKSEKLSELSERIAIKDNGVSFVFGIIALSMVRYVSVDAFVVDKCNESLQHWESLQKQLATWIYSFQFEPGSYLYFLFRKLVGSPAFSLVIWLENEKLGLLYGARLFLGILSVLTEATLVVALSRKYGRHHGLYTLAMLCLSRGCFFASTSFLPSTFSMYALSLSSAFYLLDMPTMALAVAAIGTTLGWPFLVLAFLPIIVHSLVRNQDHAFLRGLIVTFFVTVLSICFNHQFHRMWTSSIEDLLFYNVVEGGVDSSYGIEGLLYYLKNGFAHFNFAYVFACLFLVILPIVKSKYVPDMLVVVSPIYILTAYMSLQPHKEERFLYSIYPLVCVAASTVINSLPDLVRHKFTLNDNSLLVMIAKYARPCILGVILFSSYFHRSQLTNGYSALEICKQMGH